jgi:hypothetical protein
MHAGGAMQYYCHLDSSFNNIESTNLQLHSLKIASREWNKLVRLIESGAEEPDSSKERLTFILVCFGLSLSQLLGQNFSSSENSRVDPPVVLFKTFINQSDINESERDLLESVFNEFITFYDAIRHFGISKNSEKYQIIERLTFNKLAQFRNMTIEIWDQVIGIYRKDKDNDLDEFDSIEELISFNNPPIYDI